MEDIIDVSKVIYREANISKKINQLWKKLQNALDNTVYSILIDDSTDITCIKNVCVLVRFIHNNKVCKQLLDIVELEADG